MYEWQCTLTHTLCWVTHTRFIHTYALCVYHVQAEVYRAIRLFVCVYVGFVQLWVYWKNEMWVNIQTCPERKTESSFKSNYQLELLTYSWRPVCVRVCPWCHSHSVYRYFINIHHCFVYVTLMMKKVLMFVCLTQVPHTAFCLRCRLILRAAVHLAVLVSVSLSFSLSF